MQADADAAASVSCVLPTRDRAAWVGQAIRYYLRQTYPRRELVVVAAGPAAVPDAVLSRPDVRVLRVPSGTPVGTARNLGIEAATGDVIACWDDDDWYGPDRLRRQVGRLRGGAQLSGAREYAVVRLLHGEAWRYRPAAGDPPFLAGATLTFRRTLWARHPFPEVAAGEDTAFATAHAEAVLDVLDDPAWFVAVHHSQNTARTNLADPRWTPAAMDRVARRIGPDREFYARLRGAGRAGAAAAATLTPAAAPPTPPLAAAVTVPAPVAREVVEREVVARAPVRAGRAAPGDPRWAATPPSGASPARTVTVVGDLLVYDGFGSMTEYGALGIDRAGGDVRLTPLACDPAGLAPRTGELLRRPAVTGGPVLYWSWPRPELDERARHPELFVRTAWESSALPASWLAPLAGARAVVVPSRHVAYACRASGLGVPVEVVPDGVDPAVHPPQRRPERAGLTTLVVATLIPRKHVGAAVAAWRLAFDGDPEARLVVKARFRAGVLPPTDPRITVVDAEETERGLARYYAAADVLLALGNEGFGLPMVEAMATGLPVVAMDSEGQSDVCREAGDLVLAVPPAGYAPYRDPRYGVCGHAAVPDVDAVATRLRWVAAHPDEARDVGAHAARWVRRHRDVWDMGPAVLSVLEQRAAPPRALRRHRALWVSSWRTACGVSEYTGHLVDGLPRAAGARRSCTVSGARPDRQRLSLLHVQHEDALFDDAELTAFLDAVDRPVVVTEHSVRATEHPWERRADRLVALTSAGADLLRSRVDPAKVVQVEHGCPTWFPPRKARRGRVLGTFGFPAAYKRLDLVLDALRRVPGTELVLYSHPRDEADARTLRRDAAGLPVRWHTEWLRSAEVARRLALECDALVFWHDDVGHVSASGAVRVGLATGVPVLTRRTSWFADLADVTLQADDLADGLAHLLDDTDLRDRLLGAAREHCTAHSWRRVAATHLDLWQSLESA